MEQRKLKPFYEEYGFQIFHGDAAKVLPQLDGTVRCILTDPPFAEGTHRGARTMKTGKPGKLLKFRPIKFEKLNAILVECGKLTTGWVIGCTMDYRHVAKLEEAPPEGLRFVRQGIWVKPNGAPQFSGDRPGMGWEALAFLHAKGKERPMWWRGGGRNSVFTHCVVRGADHPTQKPEPLISELIQLFTDPGDTILDPFMGSGTVLRVAKNLGRKAIGIESNLKWCAHAKRRLSQGVLPFVATQEKLPFVGT